MERERKEEKRKRLTHESAETENRNRFMRIRKKDKRIEYDSAKKENILLRSSS